ncbi:hypothetical protein EXIGLDRAFT_702098 [Exidia glandulosa HHB12029]|uniref:Uncharacterized protein n=1 Tax=Exidia glandulosa HHB12029 TaxID=1314781 RepID=A0A165CPS9_EXIGL|nr:hypothetical protein EXIGLDRAFT_702098 [Exidia glandulosa HHB12029]
MYTCHAGGSAPAGSRGFRILSFSATGLNTIGGASRMAQKMLSFTLILIPTSSSSSGTLPDFPWPADLTVDFAQDDMAALLQLMSRASLLCGFEVPGQVDQLFLHYDDIKDIIQRHLQIMTLHVPLLPHL